MGKSIFVIGAPLLFAHRSFHPNSVPSLSKSGPYQREGADRIADLMLQWLLQFDRRIRGISWRLLSLGVVGQITATIWKG